MGTSEMGGELDWKQDFSETSVVNSERPAPVPAGLPEQQSGLHPPDKRQEGPSGENLTALKSSIYCLLTLHWSLSLSKLPAHGASKLTVKYQWSDKYHLIFEKNLHHCKVRDQNKFLKTDF